MSLMTVAALGVARSFSGRRWRMQELDEDAVAGLTRSTGVSQTLARILVARDVGSNEVANYLEPTLKQFLPEPLTLKEMDRAVERSLKAIKGGEKVAIFGDYDVDGSTSSALLHDFFLALGVRPRIYIPDRMTEGYGPNAIALLKLKEEGISLVITVDCGAGATAALTAARDAGLDVIVLDHHAVETAPPAFAHVNPNQPGDCSGLGHVCAAGITFLFSVALNRALRDDGWYASRATVGPDLRALVDLVGLATICDVVPLVGVNRAFARAGLKQMAKGERAGLAALAAIAQIEPPFTPYHLGFVLGPRINAGGRVGRSGLGADLLITKSPAAARELALELDTRNRERQAIEKFILEEALALAEPQANAPFLFVSSDDWHAGVVGIVAGRLKDRFGKPSFVAGFEGGLGRGSARSVLGIDIGATVREARNRKLIASGGGHSMAAGFNLSPEQLNPFRDFLADAFSNSGEALAATRELEIESILSPAGATNSLVEEIASAGPFGSGNPEPLLALPDVLVRFADIVGKEHVRLRLSGGDGTALNAIAFRSADTQLGRGLLAARGQRIHVVGRLRADEWNGRKRVQLHVEDAAASSR